MVVKETTDATNEMEIERVLWELRHEHMELLKSIDGIMEPVLIRATSSSLQDVKFECYFQYMHILLH